ncbi:putative rna recognition domain-containing protein [Erysiphe neolycopersici]|uniref:Putative rna recognition domain-containing protein n=1 Tax=Erysiphe neolycopersici TaxID=212602 RepID=A0A420HW33_9PEZI|nr:putative rna recognition domain-containing protein [Erysiphe neolycopersici]
MWASKRTSIPSSSSPIRPPSFSFICVPWQFVGSEDDDGLNTDDQLLHSFDDARSSVDALVGDNTIENYGRAFDAFSQVSRCSTPLIPPGFGSSHVKPIVNLREESIPRYTSRIVPTSASFTPRRNFSSAAIQQAQTTSALTPTLIINSSELASTHQKEVRTQKSSSSKPIKSQSIPSTLQSEDFPALESGKVKTISPSTSKVVLPSSLVSSKQPSSPVTLAQTTQAPHESRETPTLANSIPTKPNQKGINMIKSPKQAAAFPPLPASTTPIINAQVQRNIPKTLRLTSAPKPEAMSNNITSSSSLNSSLPSQVPVSRHPSVASNIKLESPDTPTSEMVSDNASITSTSLSRANSPPPTRVGSAPVRATTKSSQKKQRQAQKEKGRAGIEAIVTTEPEVEIAPIMGRKKKQKKDRIHRSTSGLAPALSRPQSPGAGSMIGDVTEPMKENINNKEKAEYLSKEKINESVPSKISSKVSDAKDNTKEKTRNLTTMDCTSSENVKIEEEPTTKPPPTPAAIFQKLLSTGAIKDPSELAFLKNISSSYRHIDLPDKFNGFEITPKLIITTEEHETLLAGKSVHKISEAGHRIMLTPNGDCVRNLSEEEEKLYLEYQSRLAKSTGPAMFVSAKHAGQNGFTMIGGRAVPSGPPSYFPTTNKGNGLDAVSKIQRDEALNYINQYVLPTLSNNTQLDKTFNASAIQGEMMRNTAPLDTSWKSWGPYDRTPTPVGTGDFYMGNSPNNDGMIDDITTHFAISDINRQNGNDGPNTTTLLSLPDAESAMQLARKEAENLEKKLNSLIKKNRKMLLGVSH